jgi:hypothetical protein
MFAENRVPQAQRIVSRSTILTRAIAHAGIENDAIPNANGAHRRSNLIHHTCTVGPRNPTRCDSHTRYATQNPKVEMIERGRDDAYSNVIRCRDFWRRDVDSKFQLIQLAVCVDC